MDIDVFDLASTVITMSELMDGAAESLFVELQKLGHCLHDILPSCKEFHVDLGPSGHRLISPVSFNDLFKNCL